jgi:hypothetical protein
MAVEVEPLRRLFTVEEYHLIEGEIIQMAPIGPRHSYSRELPAPQDVFLA